MAYRRLVRIFLERERYTVLTAENGAAALETLGAHPDVGAVILDIMMPVMDGWATCRAIREFSDVPILMLTALGDEANEVTGLKSGADDYLSKPFGNQLLVTRLKALLRRARINTRKRVAAGGVELDDAAHEFIVHGRKIPLTPKEFELLKCLVVNAGVVLERQVLLDRVWGRSYEGDPRTLDTHVKSLRAKLGSQGSRIETVRTIGYVFRGDDR